MRPRLVTQLWAGTTMALLVALLVTVNSAQSQAAIVSLQVPGESLNVGGPAFDASVVVDHVANLGAFEVQLTYDDRTLELQEVREGPFLASSGRSVTCLPPETSPGSGLLRCVTLGATPDGPNGSGVLATFTFLPIGAGTSTLHIERLILTDPPANLLPAETVDSSITVVPQGDGGFRWAPWGPVLGGVAVILVIAAVWISWYLRRPSRP
jgi:hypothetical protein